MPPPTYFDDKEIVGAYLARWTTGVLAAAMGLPGVVAGIRNGPSSAKVIYIVRIDLEFDTLVAFTAQQQFQFAGLRFSAANLSGGLAVIPQKIRDSGDPDSASLPGGPEGGDCRAATTAVLGQGAVVYGPEERVPLIGWTDPSANKKTIGHGFHAADLGVAIKLEPGEGYCLRNSVAWPAAGTGVLTATVGWVEK